MAKGAEEELCSAYFPISEQEARDSSVVKVVVDRNNRALYFSRSLIPWGSENYKKHLGVYVWKRNSLEKFFKSSHGVLEKTEKLEQLRVLEHGGRIMMMESPSDSLGIDTLEDLEKARRIINEN
jgi:3-deoxy-manno-octulosonate cytidylyltransferase (CMP-KDO synthetase)